jgi:photosystem II stability/assembly factor-like uncharacterized protein
MTTKSLFIALICTLISLAVVAEKGPKIKRYSIGNQYQIKALDFFSEKIGVATGIRIVRTDSIERGYYYVGVVLRTENGGKKWSEVLAAPNVLFSAIDLYATGEGIVAGSSAGVSAPAAVYTTANLGANWKASESSVIDNESGNSYDDAAIAIDGKMYIAGVNLYESSTQGKEWDAIAIQSERKRLNQIQASDFTDVHEQYVLGIANLLNPTLVLAKTSDKGMSWQFSDVIAGGRKHFVHDMQFASSTVGFVLLGQNNLLRTQDGGDTWKDLELNSNMQARKVHFINEKVGFIIGLKGSILRTTDGGTSWKSHLVEYDATFSAIDFIDHQTGVIAGSGGNIYILKF